MSSSDLIRIAPGDVIDDFEILEVLAVGGSSTTFRATHRSLARDVAFKFVYPAVFSDDGGAIEAARADATRVARLEHPGVAPVFAAGSHEGGLYVASAMPRGRTLADLGAEREITPADTARVLADVAAALQDAHDQDVVHRDLRPDCITVDRWGHGVVRDFGVTRTSGRTGLLTRAEILDSMRYTAPELVLGRPSTPAADVYGLAAVAVWCLTGAPPYRDRPPGEYVQFRTTAAAPILAQPDGTPAAAINAVLGTAMALEPEGRPAPVAFATALTNAIAALPTAVRSAGSPLTASEPAPPPPPPTEGDAPFALPSARDATRVEQRRPLPAEAGASAGPVPWATYVACAMLALTAGIAGLLVGRATAPKAHPPIHIGAYTLQLGDTWRPVVARGDGVRLTGAPGETATLAVSDATRLPGDPVPASMLPGSASVPRPAKAAGVALVSYSGPGGLVVARPTTKGTLVATCSKATSPQRCAGLVARANGPGKDLPVLPDKQVSAHLHDTMKTVEAAGSTASVAFHGKRSTFAATAANLNSQLTDAASGLAVKGADRGTADVLRRVSKALADEAGAADALGDAIDTTSTVAFDGAAQDIRTAHHDLVAALEALGRAGYAVLS